MSRRFAGESVLSKYDNFAACDGSCVVNNRYCFKSLSLGALSRQGNMSVDMFQTEAR
jgi:hypothetical protein